MGIYFVKTAKKKASSENISTHGETKAAFASIFKVLVFYVNLILSNYFFMIVYYPKVLDFCPALSSKDLEKIFQVQRITDYYLFSESKVIYII